VGSVTGMRETVLSMEAMQAVDARLDAENTEAQIQEISPAFDDAKYDDRFPKHALTRVRAALAWALDRQGGGLEVSAQQLPPHDDEIELPAAGCAIRLPPRFLQLPSEVLGLSPGLESFVRIALTPDPRMIDVWDLGAMEVRDLATLEREARRTVQGWEAEGATDIEVETERRADTNGRLEVDCFVQFRAQGKLTQSAQRWLAIEGQIFRIAEGGPPSLDRGVIDVARLTSSIRSRRE
jgi:hypothetical protein